MTDSSRAKARTPSTAEQSRFPSSAPSTAALPLLDRRWRPVERLIRARAIDWLSLDMFDTTIFRQVPEPGDLFQLLGHKLQEMGALFPSDTPESFAMVRQGAEQAAREKSLAIRKTAEVSIRAFYQHMPQKRLGLPVDDILRMELELEFALCHPNRDVFRIVELARAQGIKIAFLSDTYFEKDFLLRLLHKEMPEFAPDILLASQEHGFSKRQGLIELFLKKIGAQPRRILHVGDNPAADVMAARSHGIRTVYLRKYSHSFEEIILGEWGNGRALRSPLLQPREGDYGLSWLRSRLCFAEPPDAALRPWFSWGTSVIGPALVLFCDWAAERVRILAAQAGQKPVLHSLMRDGSILARILRERHPDIVTHETWINRYVTIKASLSDGRVEDIRRFLTRARRPTARQVCAELRLPLPKNLPLDVEIADELEIPFIHHMMQPEVKAALRSEALRVRANLIRHLRNQSDLDSNQRLFLLDLGYNGTIQRSLQKILDVEFGGRLESYGLYIGTSHLLATKDPALLAEGWLMAGNMPNDISYILGRAPMPLEQACMAPMGSLREHDGEGQPVCEDNPNSASQTREILAVQEGVMAFARACPAYPATDPHLTQQARRIMIRALALPTFEEAIHVGKWVHHDNFSEIHPGAMADNPDLGPLAEMPLEAVVRLEPQRLPWLFAAARRQSSILAQRLYAIFSGKIDMGLFAADDPEPVRTTIFPDFGAGFNKRNASLISAHRTDRGIVRVTCGILCQTAAPKSVAIQFGATPDDIFSPLRFRLFTHDDNGRQVIAGELRRAEQFAALPRMHIDQISPGYYRMAEPGGLFLWPLPELDVTQGVVGLEIWYTLMKAIACTADRG